MMFVPPTSWMSSMPFGSGVEEMRRPIVCVCPLIATTGALERDHVCVCHARTVGAGERNPPVSSGTRASSGPDWNVMTFAIAKILPYRPVVIPSPENSRVLFHGLCRLGKIEWASESHQELDRCLSRTITASKNFND